MTVDEHNKMVAKQVGGIGETYAGLMGKEWNDAKSLESIKKQNAAMRDALLVALDKSVYEADRKYFRRVLNMGND